MQQTKTIRPIIVLLLSVFIHFGWAQQTIRINEVCSKNNQLIVDEDGDDEDWIEIQNIGSSPINLQNYYLSDNKDEPMMWNFPDMELDPAKFLLLFASGKDKKQLIDHWETPLNGDSVWRYLNPTEQSDYDYLNWSEPDFDDSDWEWARGGFGFGYENIETVSSDILRCIYLRNEFFLTDTSKVLSLVLHAYFDDGFTVFLNGYEIHREHMLENGIKPEYNVSAFPRHASKIDSGDPPEEFVIEPIIWRNLLRNGRNVLAIQNHNFWNEFPLVIKPWLSMALSDSIIQTDSLAAIISPPSLPMHTNFKVNGDGEKIYLSDALGHIIQKIEVPFLKTNISFGYHPQLQDSLVYFSEPSPNLPNNNSGFSRMISDTIQLLHLSGAYEDSVLIEVIAADSNYRIFYTLDGSLPDTNHYQYDNAFYIDSTVVLRLQYFSDSLFAGPISNFTYFINETHDLEIFSLISDPVNLWDEEEGMYAFGNQYWASPPYFGANFWQNWEKPVLIQHFSESSELKWEQNAGMKIHGNYTRLLPQKSLGFYAKSSYEKSRFENPIIPGKEYNKSVKRFLLRNAGNDNMIAHFRDLLIHRRMSGTHLNVQNGKPVATYINGEYWGLYHLREKIDRFYLEDNEGVDPDKINLLEQNGLIINGNRNEFESLMNFVNTHTMESNSNYQFVESKIDIPNWIDHLISNLYHFNTDWPHHNTKFWNTPGEKWKQILVDQDVTMGLHIDNMAYKNPLILIHEDSLSYEAIIYQKLLGNKQFLRTYSNRFADLMNTIFLSDDYLPLVDEIISEMEFEMIQHCDRWNHNYSNWLEGSYTQDIRDFIEDRSPYMRNFLRDYYQLGTNDTITLSVNPEGKGQIKLNSIHIAENNWSGLYFDSIPIRLEAIPNPGFEFVRWESPTSPQLSDSSRIIENWYLQVHDSISAIFYSETGIEDTLKLAFTEINYRSFSNAETGDWIEIYNMEDDTVDLSGWRLKGLKPFKKWEIPAGSKIPPQEFLVLAQDSLLFDKWHSTPSVIGSFGFDLNEKETEKISLYDDLDRLVIEMTFNQKSPWPNNEESSRTIELQEIDSDFHDADNWQLGCKGGSPGLAPNDCEKNLPLLITEIKYDSHPDYETGDWFEILNTGNDSIQLSHWQIMDSNPKNALKIEDGFYIRAGEKIIVLQDFELFSQYYDIEGRWLGPLDFGLSNEGEAIHILNQFEQEILVLEYAVNSPWPEDSGDDGKTIELMDYESNMQDGENWSANCFLGTPWQNPDWCIQANSVIISEVKYQSIDSSESGDWIEVYNPNSRQLNLKNWAFIIQGDTLFIENDALIQAEDYLVFTADSSQFYSVYDSNILTVELDYFDLKKEEESISIIDPYRFPGNLLSYNYLLNWPVFHSDTNNRSLELIDYSNTYLAENWRAGCEFGTPGLPPSFCNTDGLSEINSNYQVFIQPNPTTSFVYLNIFLAKPEILHIKIIDLQGNEVLQWQTSILNQGANTIPSDLQRLKNGVYLMQIEGESGSAQCKLIKIAE